MPLKPIKAWIEKQKLPAEARAELERDHRSLPEHDPGIERVAREGLAWLVRAQQESASRDGGVARDWSLINGWNTSYPETTGYIVPTMIEGAHRYGDDTLRQSARRMLDWLVAIQLPDGGFQGGRIDSKPVVPVTFNTGQILIGLAAGVAEFGDTYRPAMRRAAEFLRDSLDPDGCWRRHPTPFAKPGEKAYETHVSWGLFEAERQEPGQGYAEAGYRQVRWALTQQKANGWFAQCCLNEPARPLTHTLGYVLRGVLEAHRLSGADEFLRAALVTGYALAACQRPDGSLPGRLNPDWSAAAQWSCLTGNSQVAHCWLMLHQLTRQENLLQAAKAANRYVRRTVDTTGRPETRGAVKGSFPVDGDYGRYEFLNWAAKFTIDSNLLELDIGNAAH
jgi:hypothetical protein